MAVLWHAKYVNRHVQTTRWQHGDTPHMWTGTHGQQVAALGHNRHVNRNAQATTWRFWAHGVSIDELLPPRARTQLAGEPAPLLCSPRTEHACQMPCITVELICETHICVGLTSLSQDCHLAGLCLCQHMLLLEHWSLGNKYTHADPWWCWEMVCVPIGEPGLTIGSFGTQHEWEPEWLCYYLVAQWHGRCENVYSCTFLWLSQDMACVQTGESKLLTRVAVLEHGSCVKSIHKPPNGSTMTQRCARRYAQAIRQWHKGNMTNVQTDMDMLLHSRPGTWKV